MVTEEQIRELAHAIWEEEGRPEGKDVEHYFRAKNPCKSGGKPASLNCQVLELPPQAATEALQPGKRKIYSSQEK
jgi:hypothetical protein